MTVFIPFLFFSVCNLCLDQVFILGQLDQLVNILHEVLFSLNHCVVNLLHVGETSSLDISHFFEHLLGLLID